MLEVREKHGCECQTGYGADEEGQVHSTGAIRNPINNRAVVAVGAQDEFLAPSDIAYFDRRLGIKTRWFSPPPEAEGH